MIKKVDKIPNHELINDKLLKRVRSYAKDNWIDMNKGKDEGDYMLARAYANALLMAFQSDGYNLVLEKDGKKMKLNGNTLEDLWLLQKNLHWM